MLLIISVLDILLLSSRQYHIWMKDKTYIGKETRLHCKMKSNWKKESFKDIPLICVARTLRNMNNESVIDISNQVLGIDGRLEWCSVMN